MTWLLATSLALLAGGAGSGSQSSAGGTTLAVVIIPQPVSAHGTPVATGRYQLELTNDWVDPLEPGEPQGMVWVDFRADGRSVAREAALVIPASAIGQITSWHPEPGRSRVDLLQSGEFLRIWVNRDGTHYLLHLPVHGGV